MTETNYTKYEIAKMNDLSEILEVFKKSIEGMECQGIHQWDEIYPSVEVVAEDIDKKQLMTVIMNEKIAAVFVCNQEYDEQYKDGAWKETSGNFRVIHRICVNPDFQNQGVGTDTMCYIENRLRTDGVKSIRLDSFTENSYAVRMYKKLGYEIVGEVHWRKGRFHLMEKIL